MSDNFKPFMFQHNNASLAFSIQTETEIEKDPVNFVALDKDTFNMWTDGINALIGNPVSIVKPVFRGHSNIPERCPYMGGWMGGGGGFRIRYSIK